MNSTRRTRAIRVRDRASPSALSSGFSGSFPDRLEFVAPRHLLDPGRVVDNEHRIWSITLKNGQFVTGIIARENDRTVTLKLPGGTMQDVKVADIKSRQDTGLSLMPEGF